MTPNPATPRSTGTFNPFLAEALAAHLEGRSEVGPMTGRWDPVGLASVLALPSQRTPILPC
ncbi:MAG: hypothetical protein RMN53_08485 [Anaerolineae bacterium]|nr:hypothetical protein [Anaerolineae bacterium]